MKYGNKVLKNVVILLICFCIVDVVSSNVYAGSTNSVVSTQAVTKSLLVSDPPTTSSQATQSTDDDLGSLVGKLWNSMGYVKDTVTDIKSEVTDIVSSIKKIFTDGLSFLIDITVGNILQGMYNKVAEGMSKWVFSTPKLVGFNWIKSLWNVAYILSIIEIVAALILTALSTTVGKQRKSGKPFNASMLAVIFILSLLGTYFSLFIADTIINFKNEAINSLVSSTLYSQYQDYKDEPYINKNLTEDDMKFESFTGDALCRMAYGLKSDSSDPGKPIYKAFIDSSGFSALGNMALAMILLTLLGILGLLLNGVLGIIGAGGPFWWGWCMATGDYDPALGWSNLFARSVLVTAIFDAAWFAAVKVNSTFKDEFLGLGQVITSLLFLIAIILACFFWFKWVAKAFMNPLTLAGAQAREWWGTKSESAGKYMENVGNHYGINQLSHKGSKMQAVGKEQQQIAKEKKEENYDWNKGNVKDRLKNVKLEHDRQFVSQDGGAIKAGLLKSNGTHEAVQEGTLKPISVPGMSNEKLYNELVANGFSGAVHKSEDGRVMIEESQSEAAKDKMVESFERAHIAPDTVMDNSIGFKVQGLPDEQIADVEKTLGDENIDYTKLSDISIDENKLNETKNNAINFETFYNSNTHNVSDEEFGNGMAGYAFSLMGEQSKAALALFQENNIRAKKKGNKIVVNAADFDMALERNENLMTTISELKSNENGKYVYNGVREQEADKLRGSLDKAGILYKENKNVWVDNEYKEDFLNSLGKVDNEGIDYTQDIEYVSYNITDSQDYSNIKKELDSILPKEAIIYTGKEKKGYINIDKDYAEKAKKAMEEYWKKTPYWEGNNGYFYYSDSKSKKIVAHLSKPKDKGRYMGKK